MMKSISTSLTWKLTLVLCFALSISSFASREPAGILAKFKEDVSADSKKELIETIPQLRLKDEHILKGFDVSFLQIESSGESTCNINAIREQLELDEQVVFTSVIYKSPEGYVAADLQEVLVRSSEGISDDQLNQMKEEYQLVFAEKHHWLNDTYVLKCYKNSTVSPRVLEAILTSSEEFDAVSVNTIHTIIATVDDPYYDYQWAIENTGSAIQFSGTVDADMSVSEAWAVTTGEDYITVAIIDSGTDTNHVDLVGNLLPGYDATGGGSGGYPNDTYAQDGHGTCSAGIVAAVGDNAMGVAGVAYSCKIVPIKLFYYIDFGGPQPFTTTTAGIDAFAWAVSSGADVMSNSWGLPDAAISALGIDTTMGNAAVLQVLQDGRNGKGAPMLFSSGNEGDPVSIWPASHPKTISVGASSMCDELKSSSDCSPESWESNYGANLDVVAPGVKILSTDVTGSSEGYNNWTDDDYAMFNGTSSACPNAAGVMALILSMDSSLNASTARAVLAITADKVGGYAYTTPGVFGDWSSEMGYGRVNAYNAVTYVQSSLGEEELDQRGDFVFYSNDRTYLQLDQYGKASITIRNLLGQEVGYFELSGDNTVQLDKDIMTAGVYLVHLEVDGESAVFRAVLD